MVPSETPPERKAFRPLAKQVAAALAGAVYPLARRELLLVARANEAPKIMLSLLEGIPDRAYSSLGEVQAGVEPAGAARVAGPPGEPT